METLNFIQQLYNLDFTQPLPIEIPGVTRYTLAQLFYELNYKTGVEVGVANGTYSEVICNTNPQLEKLYGIDPYISHKEYTDYTRKETFEKMVSDAHEKLDNKTNYEFITEFSMDAVKRFTDNSLDFVYIDANHREPFVTQDVTAWYKKVRIGGIISGHDYIRRMDHIQVIPAIQNFTRQNNIKPWFVLGANAKRVPGWQRDSARSWFWVKL